MKDNIRISEKHGVNPTLPICFFCGEEKNEIALLGRLPDDAEAPRHCIIDYEPCEKCQKEMEKGVALIEAIPTPFHDNRPLIGTDEKGNPIYPTGRLVVLTEESFNRNFNVKGEKGSKFFVPQEIMDRILPVK